jgi:excisionase family DNA binding protein
MLLTLEQTAQRLSVCRRTLERLMASGHFPRPLKVGRASRVAVSDVEDFLKGLVESREQNPGGAS